MKTQQQIEGTINKCKKIIDMHKGQEKFCCEYDDYDEAMRYRQKIINLQAEIKLLEWVLE